MITQIDNVQDVLVFVHLLIKEGLNFHPDDDFLNYVNIETNQSTYSISDSKLRNNLVYQCFVACERENIDIYDLIQELYLKETGLDRFIPLPFSL